METEETEKQMIVKELFILINRCVTFHEYNLERLELKKIRLDYEEASYYRAKIEYTKDFLIDLDLIFDLVKDLCVLLDVKNM